MMTIAQKVEVIRKVDSGRKKREVGRECDVNESTIRSICKNKDKILQMAKVLGKDMGSTRRVVVPNTVLYAEKYLSHYVQRQAAKGVPLDSREVKHRMQEFHSAVCRRHGVESIPVKASDGWLQGFLKRNKIRSADVRGEKMSADPAAAQEFVSGFKRMMSEEELVPDQVFNSDETALF